MAIAIETITATQLLHGLVGIPSLSGDEGAAVRWLCDAMADLGYVSHIDGAGNAVGTRGDGPWELLLLGHIDTVPGDIPVRIEDGVLHGRGAVDAKGPLAAFVMAGALAELPPGVRLTVIGAVGEETFGSPGATWLCHDYPKPDAVIIGEPSGWDGLVLGYKGSIALTATITRALSHSAGPETTAAEAAIAFWNAVTAFLREVNGDAAPGFTTTDGTLRSLRTHSDGLHDIVTLAATFRLPPGVTTDWLREQVTALAGSERDDVSLVWQPNAEAYRVDKRSPLVAPFLAAIRATGGTPRLKVKTGTSDMNLVGPAWGCPIVSYGPGDAAYDHTPNEQIDLAEFERGIEVLTRAIETIAGGCQKVSAP